MTSEIKRYRLRHRARPLDVWVAGEGPPLVLLHGWGLSGRAYRGAMSQDDALNILQEGMTSQFDPHLVPPFVRMMRGGKKQTGPSSDEAAKLRAEVDQLRDELTQRDDATH